MQLNISAYKMTRGQCFQSADMGLHYQTTLGTFQFAIQRLLFGFMKVRFNVFQTFPLGVQKKAGSRQILFKMLQSCLLLEHHSNMPL